MIEDLDAPDPQDQAQARSPSPAAPEDTGTDEAGQPSDENADLEQEFENMLQVCLRLRLCWLVVF